MQQKQTPDQDSYSDEEAQRRFEIALRAGLNMPHKPHKAVVDKGRASKRKTAATAATQPRRKKSQP